MSLTLTELMEKNFKAGRLTYTLDKKEAYTNADMRFSSGERSAMSVGTRIWKHVNSAAMTSRMCWARLGPIRSPR